MRVIIPSLAATLTSSSVPEPDTGEALYSAGTTYALGAQAVGNHKIYESLQAGNVGNALPVPPETETAWWIEVGVTNRHACFDSVRNTQTVTASPLVVTITPGARINSIAVMGMEAESLRIQMFNGATSVYDKTFDLRLRVVGNAYEYCFKPFGLQQSVVQFDLPPFFANTVTVTLTRAAGDVKLGTILVGNYIYCGRTQYNADNDALNFSTIDRDIYGTATLIPRRSVPKTSQTTIIETRYLNDLLDARVRLNAVPAVWSGLDDLGSNDYFESFLILGVYKQFRIGADSHGYATCTFELEEI